MSTIAASSSSVASAPVSAPVAPVRQSDAAVSGSKSGSDNSDPFGPAVVIELSPPAKETIKPRSTVDEIVDGATRQYIDAAKKLGKTDKEVAETLGVIENNIRDGFARLEVNKKYETQSQNQQPNLEQTLSDTGGPQSLIDAVRDVTRVRNDVGASGVFEASYAKKETRDQIRANEGEDALRRSISSGKAYDAAARANAVGSASALSRYGIDKPAFSLSDGGKLKLNSFTLQNISGGYSLAFDADKAEFKVSRQGIDITAALFAGKVFS